MRKIGILDSGIGGLTTCSYILRQIPQIKIIYYSDNANAPYGTKTPKEVYECVRRGVEYLALKECDLIVLACNTATAVAAAKLRSEYRVPIVGIEPSVKSLMYDKKNTLYLATPLTTSEKGADGFMTADTTRLAEVIEAFFDNENIMSVTALKLLTPKVKNVVIGCTHYGFLTKHFFNADNGINVYDGSEGVARRVRSLLPSEQFFGKRGVLYFCFSGDKQFAKYYRAFSRAFEGTV